MSVDDSALLPLPETPARGWARLAAERPRPDRIRKHPGAWKLAVATVCRPSPLVDLRLLAAERIGVGLLGALSGYLVLFGPLVLVPVVLDRQGVTVETAGAVLTALPAGFALAATMAERVLPGNWGDRRRARWGAVATTAALLLLVAPVSVAALPWPLLLLGLGLGVFTPANNTLVMRAIPASSAGTAGGLVNMARGLGTALGVAVVTLALHLAGHGPAATRIATAVLLAASVGALASALPGRRKGREGDESGPHRTASAP